jgi:hypothetical protein
MALELCTIIHSIYERQQSVKRLIHLIKKMVDIHITVQKLNTKYQSRATNSNHTDAMHVLKFGVSGCITVVCNLLGLRQWIYMSLKL